MRTAKKRQILSRDPRQSPKTLMGTSAGKGQNARGGGRRRGSGPPNRSR